VSHLYQVCYIDRMVFGRMSFHGKTRWAVTVCDPQMVGDRKIFGKHLDCKYDTDEMVL